MKIFDKVKNEKPEDILDKLEEDMLDIIVPDTHVPYHDKNAIKVVEKVIRKKKPDRLIHIGDMYDFYSISRFDKDPSRLDQMQQEFDVGYGVWKQLKKAGKKTMKIYYTQGNHEVRHRKYLWKHPEINNLRAMKFENLTGIKDFGIKYYKSSDTLYLRKNLIATHGAKDDGCKTSQYSGYSAKNTLQKTGVNGVSGHTHRLASHYKRNFDKQLEWHECGCLCDLDPEYVKKPNWQHGFALVEHKKDKFNIRVVPIKEGYWCMVNGKEYEA